MRETLFLNGGCNPWGGIGFNEGGGISKKTIGWEGHPPCPLHYGKHCPNFLKNGHFLPPDMGKYLCVSGGKKYLFFGKFDKLCFLETFILRFALSPITDEFTRKLKAKLKSFLRASPSVQLKGSDKRQHCLVPCKFGFDAFGFISLLTLHSCLLHMTLILILFFDITPNDGS